MADERIGKGCQVGTDSVLENRTAGNKGSGVGSGWGWISRGIKVSLLALAMKSDGGETGDEPWTQINDDIGSVPSR